MEIIVETPITRAQTKESGPRSRNMRFFSYYARIHLACQLLSKTLSEALFLPHTIKIRYITPFVERMVLECGTHSLSRLITQVRGVYIKNEERENDYQRRGYCWLQI